MENINSDGYSSVKDYFDELVYNPWLFDKVVPNMFDEVLIQFYDYIVRKFEEEPREVTDPLWGVVMQLEMMPIIDEYKRNKEENLNGLTDKECKEIDDIIAFLDTKKKTNPIKRLLKYIKGE